MVNQIVRFVCFVSSIVGLVSYAISSSFNNLFGIWNLWKILLYTFFSFTISLVILFANKWQNSNTSLKLKAHLVFSVFIVTTVYSFFFDKVNGKPDLYSLVSGAAFAIMSLGLSKQCRFGFEVDLLYFFCGYLTLQFMKINLYLVVAGASFSYILIVLRYYLCDRTDQLVMLQQQQQDQDSAVIIQVNQVSQQGDTVCNRTDHHYSNVLSEMKLKFYRWILQEVKNKMINGDSSLDSNIFPQQRSSHMVRLEELNNNLRKTLEKRVADGYATERTSELLGFLESNARDNLREEIERAKEEDAIMRRIMMLATTTREA